MARSLTMVAISTRKTIRYGIYTIIILSIARITFGVGFSIYRSAFPEGPPPPTSGFSVLPAIPFPEPIQQIPQLTFKLETATGGVPEFPDQMKVYFMPRVSSTLSSFETAVGKAGKLGFTSQPVEISPTVFRFANSTRFSTLEMNITSGAFSVSYNLAADPSPLSTLPPTPEKAEKDVKSIFKSIDSLPEDLSEGPTASEFLKVESQKLVSAVSLSEANLIRLSLFRKSFEEGKYPSLTSNPTESNAWIILSGEGNVTKKIIAAEYHYFPIDEERFETYAIKDSQSAWNELVSGEAYIADLGINSGGDITIREI